jgi:hypothetical protein
MEAPSHGRIHGREWRPAVHPPNRPLPRLGVEGSWSHAAISAARNLEHVVVYISVATHQWLAEQCAFEFDPLVTVDEALLQLSMMNSPVPHQKIEVMESGHRTFCVSYLFSRTRGGLRDRDLRRHEEYDALMPDLSREYLTTSVPVIEDIVVPFMT